MVLDVFILASPFDTRDSDIYRSLVSLSRRKGLKGKIAIRKILVNSDIGEELLEKYRIEDTPAIIVCGKVISEGEVPIKYLHEILKEMIEEDIERTRYIY